MDSPFEFLIFLGAFLLIAGVWSIALDVSRIVDWLRKDGKI